MHCQNCCKFSAFLQCSKCRHARYCDEKCQKIDWPLHQQFCPLLAVLVRQSPEEAQRLALQSGSLRINFLHEKPGMKLSVHGNDTSPCMKATAHVRILLNEMKVNRTMASVTRTAGTLLSRPFGCCLQNVKKMIEANGGASVGGWKLFEGRHLVEAEAHFVWTTGSEPHVFVDVTRGPQDEVYTCLFVPDEGVIKYISSKSKFPPNIVLWK